MKWTFKSEVVATSSLPVLHAGGDVDSYTVEGVVTAPNEYQALVGAEKMLAAKEYTPVRAGVIVTPA